MENKKITLATVKSFIKKNQGNLFIAVKSSFDGMTDCVEQKKGDFSPVKSDADHLDYTFGIKGAWFVGSSRDYFESYQKDGFTGFEVYNCCGSFILAVK